MLGTHNSRLDSDAKLFNPKHHRIISTKPTEEESGHNAPQTVEEWIKVCYKYKTSKHEATLTTKPTKSSKRY